MKLFLILLLNNISYNIKKKINNKKKYKIIKEVDKDSDGIINFEEFMELMLKIH